MNISRSQKGILSLLLIISAALLAGCGMNIVPTQYDLRLTSKTEAIEAYAGETGEIEIRVNSSRFDDLSSEGNNTFISYHCYTEDGELVEYDGVRTELELIPARGKKNVTMIFIAPSAAGEYVLEVDLVEEGVTWFSSQGMPTLSIPLTVLETGDDPL